MAATKAARWMARAQAARRGQPESQAPPNVSTLWRWCLKGCKGVKLESVCIGSKRYVTASAMERFIAARSQPGAPTPPTTVNIDRHSTPRVQAPNDRRRKEIEAARRRLDELTGSSRRPSTAPPSAS